MSRALLSILAIVSYVLHIPSPNSGWHGLTSGLLNLVPVSVSMPAQADLVPPMNRFSSLQHEGGPQAQIVKGKQSSCLQLFRNGDGSVTATTARACQDVYDS